MPEGVYEFLKLIMHVEPQRRECAKYFAKHRYFKNTGFSSQGIADLTG